MLYIAVEKSATEIVELLLDQVKCVDEADDKGFTALMVASKGGHADVIEPLLARNATFTHVQVTSALRCILQRWAFKHMSILVIAWSTNQCSRSRWCHAAHGCN